MERRPQIGDRVRLSANGNVWTVVDFDEHQVVLDMRGASGEIATASVPVRCIRLAEDA